VPMEVTKRVDCFPAMNPVFQGPFPTPMSAHSLSLNRPCMERVPVGMGASLDALLAFRREIIFRQCRIGFIERVGR
jgi:hypothetical protein